MKEWDPRSAVMNATVQKVQDSRDMYWKTARAGQMFF
jgi:hypothetical protein